jgi:hypothetical protein
MRSQRSRDDRKWQDKKEMWLARDVYRVERGVWAVGLVLGLPAAVLGAVLMGWVVVALTDYVMR